MIATYLYMRAVGSARIAGLLELRPCQSVLERRQSARWKIILESGVILLDIGAAITVIAALWLWWTAGDEQLRDSGWLFGTTLAAYAAYVAYFAVACAAVPVYILCFYRAYSAWKGNRLMYPAAAWLNISVP